MRTFLLKFFIFLLSLTLFACTGGMGPGGAANPLGGPPGPGVPPPGALPPGAPPPGAGAAPPADGTVGSQVGLPGLGDNDCLSKYLMLFGGETPVTPSGTLPPPGEATPTVAIQPILYTLAADQTLFPDRAIVNIQN